MLTFSIIFFDRINRVNRIFCLWQNFVADKRKPVNLVNPVKKHLFVKRNISNNITFVRFVIHPIFDYEGERLKKQLYIVENKQKITIDFCAKNTTFVSILTNHGEFHCFSEKIQAINLSVRCRANISD